MATLDELRARLRDVIDSPVIDTVEQRMQQFREADDLFCELCFCTLTANTSAEKAIEVQEQLRGDFCHLEQEQLRGRLKETGYRFTNRAAYICHNRRYRDIDDVLQRFDDDEASKAVIMVGEIGGSAEENAAAYIEEQIDMPVVAYIAGRTAPKGKRMGHAGAIVSKSGTGTAESKIKALEQAGVSVARMPTELGELLDEAV